MEPGDLVLTPSWTWHDHNNEGDEPMIWLDGLDVPLVRYLRANFYEAYPEDQQPIVGVAESERKFASGSLRPAWEDTSVPYSPLWHYKWDKTYEALQRLAEVDASPFDDVAMEFSDPVTGGPVLRTMTCWVQMIRPGICTRAHRQTSCAVYQVYKGEGYSVIDGQRFDWREGDFFVVPPFGGLARTRQRRFRRGGLVLHPGHPGVEGHGPVPGGTLRRERRSPTRYGSVQGINPPGRQKRVGAGSGEPAPFLG